MAVQVSDFCRKSISPLFSSFVFSSFCCRCFYAAFLAIKQGKMHLFMTSSRRQGHEDMSRRKKSKQERNKSRKNAGKKEKAIIALVQKLRRRMRLREHSQWAETAEGNIAGRIAVSEEKKSRDSTVWSDESHPNVGFSRTKMLPVLLLKRLRGKGRVTQHRPQ